MPEHALIDIQNAGYRVRDRWLVRGVTLAVQPGEIVTLIGPNGAGKSTTVKLALGLLPVSEGTSRKQAGLKVSYVPQRVHIDHTLPMTTSRFMCLMRRFSHQEIHAALEMTGIAALKKQSIQNLSGGEFQRLLLARAIASQPDLLVLDEPVQGVDFAGEIALYELIADIRARTGVAILLISHDLHVVMRATDRVICLNGHVCCQGSPESVVASDQYRALFGLHATDVLALYSHHHDHEHLADVTVQRLESTDHD